MNLSKRFTEDQIAQASQVNIIAYAMSRGYEVKRISPRSYKISGYGGLYINADGQKWNCFSKGSGGGTIQFLMEMENLTWVDSIKELLGLSDEELPYVEPPSKDSEVKGTLILPEKNNTFKHIFAYLIKTRKIDADIVSRFVKEKKIYEDTYQNCVFVGSDDKKEPKFASVRGTNTNRRFRRDIENSDKGYPFCQVGESDTLCVFESAIDLMSYLTLIRIHGIDNFSHHLISIGGTSYIPIDKYLDRNSEISKLILCLDSDDEGHFFSQKIKERFCVEYEIYCHIPKGKDFNEELLNSISYNSNIRNHNVIEQNIISDDYMV